jgi:hypothetical protein
MGLRNLPSKCWQVNRGWVLAAWCRLPGLYDQDDLKDAEPDTLLPALAPARPADPARPQTHAEDQRDLALEGGIHHLLATAVRPARIDLTSTNRPRDIERRPPGAGQAGASPGIPGSTRHPLAPGKRIPQTKPGITQPIAATRAPPESLRLAA